MDKICQLCNKLFSARTQKQKYCSVECQYQSYRVQKVERINVKCCYCGNEFLTIPNRIKQGKGKYCSRECKDTHQKYTYSGESNPQWGVTLTDERKKQISESSKKMWKSEDYRKIIADFRKLYYETNGFYLGADEKSKEKRRNTMIERYGVEHNWIGKYGERKCDKTTIDLYGKSAIQFLIDFSHTYGKKTDIEVIFAEILEELNIPYQLKYRIYDKEKINFWYREYDFLIGNTNILVEIDGDYWHGNEDVFNDLTNFQKTVKVNDEIKEEFAVSNGFKIIRFWGSDVKKNKDYVKSKINEIWEKLK